MAKTSKKQLVTEQVVLEHPKQSVIPEKITPKMQSIAFDKNSNLYGISYDSSVYRYDFDRKEWLIV